MEIRGKRLPFEREQELAAGIRAAEDEVREALAGVAASDRVLGTRAAGTWRTRAERVVQLGAAIEAVEETAGRNPRLAGKIRKARKAWEEAERLRWELAM